jgi:hypothetical protein
MKTTKRSNKPKVRKEETLFVLRVTCWSTDVTFDSDRELYDSVNKLARRIYRLQFSEEEFHPWRIDVDLEKVKRPVASGGD